MKCQVDIFGDPRNVTLENKKGECGTSKVMGSLGPARLPRLVGGLGFWEGPVQRPCPGAAPILPPCDPSCSWGLFKLLSHTSVIRFSFSPSPRFQHESVSGSHTRCPRVGGARRIHQHLQIPAPSTQAQSTASRPPVTKAPGPRAAETRLSSSQIFICSVVLSIRITSCLKDKENMVRVHGCICVRMCAGASVCACVHMHVCL